MFGSALARVIVPVRPVRLIVSESLLLPAPHSPAVGPEAVSVLAAVIASRRVHKPSAPSATSSVLLTVIVLPAGRAVAVGGANANKIVITQIEAKYTTERPR